MVHGICLDEYLCLASARYVYYVAIDVKCRCMHHSTFGNRCTSNHLFHCLPCLCVYGYSLMYLKSFVSLFSPHIFSWLLFDVGRRMRIGRWAILYIHYQIEGGQRNV
jgi:hypothetical protein